MHRIISTLAVFVVILTASNAFSAVRQVDISPTAGAALNLGTVIYPGDHALGLAAANVGTPPASNGTGNELGSGIFFDDVTNGLTLDFGYGSAFGFTDLASDWNGGIHIHGNGTDTAHFPAPNTNAGVAVLLADLHISSGLRSGRVTGSVELTPTQATWLLDNQLYVNIHTTGSPGGEIRGQLTIVPEPSTLILTVVAGLALVALRRRGQ